MMQAQITQSERLAGVLYADDPRTAFEGLNGAKFNRTNEVYYRAMKSVYEAGGSPDLVNTGQYFVEKNVPELAAGLAALPVLSSGDAPPLAEHPTGEQFKAEVVKLLALDPVERERRRKEISEQFGVRAKVIDEELARISPPRAATDNHCCVVREEEPAEDAVNGAELLDQMADTIKRHVIIENYYIYAIALWSMLTYCFDIFRIVPQLGVSSPDKRCGKTTLIEILHGLVKKPVIASNISPAAVYRVIEKYSPTLIVDEADTFLKDNIELRGILNSGHTRATAFVIRVDPESLEPFKFNTFGPKVIAGIGQQSDTQRDRSIKIMMRRKMPGENAERLTMGFEDSCTTLRRGCLRWAVDNMEAIRAAVPAIQSVGNDRAEDNWYPLFAIAEVAGGSWPAKVEATFRVIEGAEVDDSSIGPVLLRDIKSIFQDRNTERIFSDNLVEALVSLTESPWSEWRHGKGLTQNNLCRLLRDYEIRPAQFRIGDKRQRGYLLASFQDAFKRYLPPSPSFQSGTTGQLNNFNNLKGFSSGTEKNHVSLENEDNCPKLQQCPIVPVETPMVEVDV